MIHADVKNPAPGTNPTPDDRHDKTISENPFHALYRTAYRGLLPIVPPNLAVDDISEQSTLRDKPQMLGKIPGALNADGKWAGLAGWQHWRETMDDLLTWHRAGAGVGLRCEQVLAVDIDITDPALANIAEAQAGADLGFGPVRTGNAPKRLVLYRHTVPGALPTKRKLAFTMPDGSEHAVELLGARQQFVVYGIHPKTGKPYTWDEDPADVGLAGLPEVTLDEIDTFMAGLTDTLTMLDAEIHESRGAGAEARDAESLRTDDLDLLREAVESIPNDEDTTREQFVQMAHAVHAAAGDHLDEGREIFADWAERRPGGQSPGEPERVFDSVHESGIGIQWLLEQARTAGYQGDIARDFAAPVGERQVPEGDEVLAEGADDGSLWSEYVYVNRLKRFVHRRSNAELDKEQFNDRHRVPDSDDKPADLFLDYVRPSAWADDVDYRPGDGTVLRRCPRSGMSLLNRWRPGPAHNGDWQADAPVVEADIAPWLELAEHLFPAEAEREVLFDWMAYLLQHPGEKPNWHPLVGGHIHGTGKDSLFEPLKMGLGSNAVTIRMSDLEGQWTWWAENVQLVVVSEINSFERRSVMNRLKSYMAAPPYTIEINKKGQPQYETPNLFGMVMFTNNEDAVALEQSDRRFFVVWTDAQPLSFDFYANFHQNWLHHGGAEAAVRWLMQRDISAFSVKGNAPNTDAKEAMRVAALPPAEGNLVDAISNESSVFAADIVTNGQVSDWLKAEMARPPSASKIGVLMRAAGAVRLGRVRVDDHEGRQHLWAVRSTELYQQLADSWGLSAVRDKMMTQRAAISMEGAARDFGT